MEGLDAVKTLLNSIQYVKREEFTKEYIKENFFAGINSRKPNDAYSIVVLNGDSCNSFDGKLEEITIYYTDNSTDAYNVRELIRGCVHDKRYVFLEKKDDNYYFLIENSNNISFASIENLYNYIYPQVLWATLNDKPVERIYSLNGETLKINGVLYQLTNSTTGIITFLSTYSKYRFLDNYKICL